MEYGSYIGPTGSMPDFSTDEGARIRALLQDNPQWVEQAMLEMGVDPFTARFYGRNGGDPEQISQYLDKTREPRAARRNESGRRRTANQPQPRLPWGDK